MPWLDRPAAALPVLLGHLDGDRARVAAYALPALARRLPAATVAAALAEVLTRERLKVTVHKEVLRLLGGLRTPAAVAALRGQWARPDLHRDVRIAAAHAARQQLESEDAWAVLDAAARPESEPDVVLALLDVSPAALPLRHRARYRQMLLSLATHPDPRVRSTLFGALADAAVPRPSRARRGARGDRSGPPWRLGAEAAVSAVCCAAVLDPGSGPAWAAATRGLAACATAAAGQPALLAAVRTLLVAARDEAREPAAERDLPFHQRLDRLAAALGAAPGSATASLRAALRAVADELLAERRYWAEGADLAARALAWEAPDESAERLAALAAAAPGPAEARALEAATRTTLAESDRPWTAESLEVLARRLAARSEPAARRLAVAALWAAVARGRWDPARCALLTTLRRDPARDVATAACRLYVHDE